MSIIEPIVWETYDTVDIRDINHENIEDLAKFVFECQLDDLLLHPKMKNEKNEVYTKMYQYLLKQGQSLIAFDRETEKVIGVIVCLIMTDRFKTWSNLRLKSSENERHKSFFNLFYIMACQAHNFQPPGTPMDSVHVFRIAVPKSNKGNNWKPRLLNAVIKMTANLKIPCVTYVGFSINDQIRAERAGMKEQLRFYYSHYIDPDTGKRPFVLTKRDELCVIFYRRAVEKVTPYYKISDECKVTKKRPKSSRRYYRNDVLTEKSNYISSGNKIIIK